MEGHGYKPSEDSVGLVIEGVDSAKDRTTIVKPAPGRIRLPRVNSLVVAGSLVFGGVGGLINRAGSSEGRRTPTGQEVGNNPVANWQDRKEAQRQQIQEAVRQPVILEARAADIDQDTPFKVNYESMGLSGKRDPATNTLVDVTTKRISSDKFHSDVENSEVKEVIPLLKVRRDFNGNIIMTDVSPTGIDRNVLTGFEGALSPILDVMDATFREGDMWEYNFVTQKKPGDRYWDHSQHNPGQKVVYIDMDLSQGVVYPEEIQKTSMHEFGHAIFGKRSISADVRERHAHPSDVEKFTEACKAVRDIAVDELEGNASGFITKLEEVGGKIPQIRPTVDQLIQVIEEKRLNDLFPQKKYDGEAYKVIDTCRFIFGPDMLSEINNTLGENFDFNILPDGKASEEERKVLKELSDFTRHFVHRDSVYRVITDATYAMEPEAGHPYDNLDEVAASMFMITQLAPSEFASLLDTLSPEHRAALMKLYVLVMDEYTGPSQRLSQILKPNIDKIVRVDFREGVQASVDEALRKAAEQTPA